MINRGNKTIDKEKSVWLCISCSRRVIAKDKPEICSCGMPQFVLEGNLIVIK